MQQLEASCGLSVTAEFLVMTENNNYFCFCVRHSLAVQWRCPSVCLPVRLFVCCLRRLAAAQIRGSSH